jgi:hypothetical protein
MQCQKGCITYFKTNGITPVRKHTMKKWGDLQLALQLIFWVVMNICNSFAIQRIFWGVMLLNKLHELQWMQLVQLNYNYVRTTIV